MSQIHHKDQSPQKTIDTIQNILTRVGFKLENRKIIWKKAFKNCHSCMLIFIDYPFIRSNGKGLTKEFALASAYGEFIERFQALTEEFFFSFLGIVSDEKSFFHPYRFMSKHALKKNHPFLFKILGEENFKLIEEKLPTLPFCNLTKNRIEPLPFPLMRLLFRSNGMCAGNTNEEAICQGISEVFERSILYKLKTEEIKKLPTLTLENLSIASGRVKELIQQIESKGFIITIKDCTLGGKIPVISVLIENPKNQKMGVSVGSDAVFDIALERCLTELYQGKTNLTIEKDNERFQQRYSYNIFNNPHIFYEILKKEAPFDPKYKNAFAPKNCSNRTYLNFLIKKAKTLDSSIYVLDLSFLGFPTFFVYIENYSFNNDQAYPNLEFYKLYRNRFFSSLFRLKEVSKKEIQFLAKTLEKYGKDPGSIFHFGLSSFSLQFPIFSWLEPRILLSFLFIELEKYDKAIEALSHPLHDGNLQNKKIDKEVKEIISNFCSLKLKKLEDEKILKKMHEKFSSNSFSKSLKHLIQKNYSSFLKKDEMKKGEKFEKLPIPNCLAEDHCFQCQCLKNCYYLKWNEIRHLILKESKHSDVNRLLSIKLS